MNFVKPSRDYLSSYLEALEEGRFSNMALEGFGDWTQVQIEADPDGYIALLNAGTPREIVTPNGEVYTLNDHEMVWITEGERFLGSVSLRFDKDNPLLERYCGHAGMSMRPALINKGYGIRAAQNAWQKVAETAKVKGLPYLLASADPDNRPSSRLIKYCGGVLISTEDPFGYGPNELYRINLD